MSLLIPITGIDASFRVPGAFAEILFAQGESSASAGVRTVCFVMPKLSTGTWAANVRVRVNNAGEAEQGGGAGSPIHRGIRKFMSINKDAKVFACPVAETTGGSPIAATATVTFVNAATGTGTVVVTILDEDCSFTFNNGAAITAIGDGIRDAINAKSWLPVTAVNAAGVVTLTAKLKGVSQGTASLGVIRIRSTITSGVATTCTLSGAFLGTGAAGVEGSTTEAANLATALVSLESVDDYFLVSSACDATSWGNLKTHLIAKNEPKRGILCVAIAAYTGAQSAVQTLAVGKNYELLNVVNQVNPDHDCAELAGAWAAFRQKREQVDSAYNFDSTNLDPFIRPANNTADWPDADDQNDAINDGVTCIASNTSGAYVVMSVNTRSKNSAGTQDDFRATETHRPSVAHEFTGELKATWGLNYSNKKLKDDEFLANGKVNPNQRVIRDVLTPSRLVPVIRKQMDEYEAAGKLQNTAKTKESIQCKKTGSRIEVGFDINVIDHAHQATFRIAEVSTG